MHRSKASSPRWAWCTALVVTATAMTGCSPVGDSNAVDIPAVDPRAAASQANELYDKNRDGRLNASELAACPGLLAAKNRYDTDKDGSVSNEEIAAGLTQIYNAGAGLLGVTCTVTRAGQPLNGVKVRFAPEPFLGDAIKAASGITDENGNATIAVPDDQLPADQRGLQSMQPGIYRIEFEHASIRQAPKPQGCEINPSVRGGNSVNIRL